MADEAENTNQVEAISLNSVQLRVQFLVYCPDCPGYLMENDYRSMDGKYVKYVSCRNCKKRYYVQPMTVTAYPADDFSTALRESLLGPDK